MKKILALTLLLLSIPLGKHAFAYDYEANGLYYFINASRMTATVTYGDNPYEGAVFIPDSIIYKGKSLPVKYIGGSAFEDCTNLTSIQLGHCIEWITQSAFEGCINLTSLTIPSNVVAISERAFYGCTNLTNLTIEDGDNRLYIESTNNTSPPPSSLAFDCKLQYLYIGRPINYDLDNSYLSTIIIGSKITSIGGFAGSKISAITIPANVTLIEEGCFKNCKSLKSVNFEDGNKQIVWKEAYDTTINFTIESVCPFYDCPIEDAYIGRIIVPTSNNIRLTSYDGPFDRTSIKHVTISNSLKSLCGFNYCDYLKEIDIPASVKEMYGFKESNSLMNIRCRTPNPPTVKGYYPFVNNIYLNGILYVPKGSKSIYEDTGIWKNFFNIQEFDDDIEVEAKKCAKPTINYSNGKLTFVCETKDAICKASITDTDIQTYSGNEILLGVTYVINVYATKFGYENSETVTATLCWVDQQPMTEGIINNISQIPARAVLIQSQGGILTIQGVDEGSIIAVYNVSGQMVGCTRANGNQATLATKIKKGEVAIIKIGEKSVKKVMQ